jgi:hypothetical protein
MLIRSRYIVMMVAALLCGARAEAQATKTPALDADVEFNYTLPNGQKLSKSGHIYRSANGMVRQDIGNGSSIADTQTGTITLLNPVKKEARVITIPAELRKPPQLGGADKMPASARPFEEATINGHRIAKTRATGPNGQKQEVWTATDLGIVTFARVEANGVTTTQELKNLAVREPDPKVFEVPSDYTVVREPTRADLLNSRVPQTGNLPFGNAGTLVPMPAPKDSK